MGVRLSWITGSKALVLIETCCPRRLRRPWGVRRRRRRRLRHLRRLRGPRRLRRSRRLHDLKALCRPTRLHRCLGFHTACSPVYVTMRSTSAAVYPRSRSHSIRPRQRPRWASKSRNCCTLTTSGEGEAIRRHQRFQSHVQPRPRTPLSKSPKPLCAHPSANVINRTGTDSSMTTFGRCQNCSSSTPRWPGLMSRSQKAGRSSGNVNKTLSIAEAHELRKLLT